MKEFDFGLALPAPLVKLLWPKTPDEVVSQDSWLGRDGRLRLMLAPDKLGSIILRGKSGAGKITFARLIAGAANMLFDPPSAVLDGFAELQKVFARAVEQRKLGRRTLLFVDEVHRLDKA